MSDDDWFERAFEDVDRDVDTVDAERGGSAADSDSTDATATPFDEDFATALAAAPPPDGGPEAGGSASRPSEGAGSSFGDDDFSLFAGMGGHGFSDGEQFDSALDRLDVGIDGLDEMILGGVPTRSLIATIGSAGTGKTTVAMQFLNTALEAGDNAVYITLEESRDRILDTATEKGWAFDEYEDEGILAIVDLDPVEMANSLGSLRNDLSRLIERFGAERLVLDSVSLLEMMYDHPAQRRSEVFQFARALKRAGVTVLVTSEASDTDPYASRYGVVEYLADAVFVLQYVRSNEFQETRLAVEIQKIRDANHSRQPKPYEITSDGISVYQQANLF